MLKPSVIEISLTDSCTRACAICPRHDESLAANNDTSMSLSLLCKIADDIAKDFEKFDGSVVFSGFGEPLLHPFISDAIKIVSPICKVDLVTNGDLLNFEEMLEMYRCGLNRMHISVYDPSRLGQIESIFKGVDSTRYEIRRRWEPFMTTNRGGTMGGLWRTGPCYYTAYLMTIDWNGDVLPCPHDWGRRVKFGNVAHQNLWSIWNCKAFRDRRKILFKERAALEPCKKCDCNGMIRGIEQVEAWREDFKRGV